ncbi:AI-2E family transporter [Alphaproteobacteria bacterium]|nr:AI-2E family transporter [Alphaproteobacteria bacterium]
MNFLKKPGIFWLLVIVAVLLLLYSVRSIMTPFVLGIVIAYFLDPLADRLETKMSRSWAVTIIAVVFSFVFTMIMVLVIPALVKQIIALVSSLPAVLANAETFFYNALNWLGNKLPFIELPVSAIPEPGQSLASYFESEQGGAVLKEIQNFVTSYFGDIASGVKAVVSRIWSGSMAVIGLISLILVTPVVTIYFLYEWNRMVADIDRWLPRSRINVIRKLANDVDQTLAAFIRGQMLVCLFLAIFYAIALLLIGLNYWLIVGIIIGALSFIPYVGAIIGFSIAMVLALFQFDSFGPIIAVLVVFFAGQFLEGQFITPRLVGNRVGLHPLWVIFALLAGGVLFGFIGVLTAIPTAAVIGVFVRFGFQRYMGSGYYDPAACGDQGKPLVKFDEDPPQDESTTLV